MRLLWFMLQASTDTGGKEDTGPLEDSDEEAEGFSAGAFCPLLDSVPSRRDNPLRPGATLVVSE